MEQNNLPIVTRKLWNIIRIAFYMLRKNINKKKILLDLNLLIKRSKFVAEKTIVNLIFNQQHNDLSKFNHDEYEFSCTNTPLYRQFLTNNLNKRSKCNSRRQNSIEDVNSMWEMMIRVSSTKESPMVKQLRVTDSPYPLHDEYTVEVDKAADEFIKRFYSQIKAEIY